MSNNLEKWLLKLIPDGWVLTRPGSEIGFPYPYKLENHRQVVFFSSRRDVIFWLCKKDLVSDKIKAKHKYNEYYIIRQKMNYRTEEETKKYLIDNQISDKL